MNKKALSKTVFLILFIQNLLFSQENNSFNKYPEFVGGMAELNSFISDNFEIPPSSIKLFSNGTINVTTIIDKNGNIELVEKSQTNDSLLNISIAELIEKMPKWNPAIKNDSSIGIITTLPLKIDLLTTPEKKNRIYSNSFLEFKHFKSASIKSNESLVRINGKIKGGDIVIKCEEQDFELEQKLYEIKNRFENSEMEIREKRGVVLNGINAEVAVGMLSFSSVASSLLGDMEIKFYKIEKDSKFYSICIIEFAEDVDKNYKQNATVMSSIRFN
ncbi:MAG: hypothetical protein JEY96_19815 [Bacteroidales bacterium]|nr:hypothetical protein [Bacteroidales bacterium]